MSAILAPELAGASRDAVERRENSCLAFTAFADPLSGLFPAHDSPRFALQSLVSRFIPLLGAGV